MTTQLDQTKAAGTKHFEMLRLGQPHFFNTLEPLNGQEGSIKPESGQCLGLVRMEEPNQIPVYQTKSNRDLVLEFVLNRYPNKNTVKAIGFFDVFSEQSRSE